MLSSASLGELRLGNLNLLDARTITGLIKTGLCSLECSVCRGELGLCIIACSF